MFQRGSSSLGQQTAILVSYQERITVLEVASLSRELLLDERRLVSLYETSLAVVSSLQLDEILNRVVDCTRILTGAEKAVLILTKPAVPRMALDLNTMVVRGKRTAHPEKWWRGKIERAAKNVAKKGSPVLLANEMLGNGSSLVCVPVESKGRNIAILSAINSLERGFRKEDIFLLTILASHAASAIENSRLYSRAKKVAAANEKARIAREMHDSTLQALFGLILSLESCLTLLSSDPEAAREKLKSAQAIASRSLKDLRENILALKTDASKNVALSAKLKDQIKEFNDTRATPAELTVEGKEHSLPKAVENGLHRVLGEALSNISKHAQADEVLVKLSFSSEKVRLTVRDDGKGFDVQRALSVAGRREKMGLTNMFDRAETLGGCLRIESSLGKGTKITVSLPG